MKSIRKDLMACSVALFTAFGASHGKAASIDTDVDLDAKTKLFCQSMAENGAGEYWKSMDFGQIDGLALAGQRTQTIIAVWQAAGCGRDKSMREDLMNQVIHNAPKP